MLPKLEALLQRAAVGHALLLTCMLLALFGTATAAYPVTAIVVPAVLLVPRRWLAITVFTALGSACGATLLVLGVHELGWSNIYERYPQLLNQENWNAVQGWVSNYGIAALLVVAATPLPQTPALILFGMTDQNYAAVFAAMLLGKLFKYGLCAWLTRRFPEHIGKNSARLRHWFRSGRR